MFYGEVQTTKQPSYMDAYGTSYYFIGQITAGFGSI